jgi:hypothetical protein
MSQAGICFCRLVDFHAQDMICCMRKRFHFFLQVFKKVKLVLKLVSKSLEKALHGVPHDNNPPGLLSHSSLEHVFFILQLIFQSCILYIQGNIFCMRKSFHPLLKISKKISFIDKIIYQILKNGFYCSFSSMIKCLFQHGIEAVVVSKDIVAMKRDHAP